MREGSRDGRWRGGIPERESRRGTHACSPEPAINPPRAVLDLLGESEGVSTKKGTRPVLAGTKILGRLANRARTFIAFAEYASSDSVVNLVLVVVDPTVRESNVDATSRALLR